MHENYSRSGAQLARTIDTVAPQSPVSAAVTKIEQNVASAHGLFDAIEQRLGSILRPAPPQANATNPSPLRALESPLVDSLDDIGTRAAGLEVRMRELLDRITL